MVLLFIIDVCSMRFRPAGQRCKVEMLLISNDEQIASTG